MKASEAQIKERLPVWESLSEFFLDTKLDAQDYERIAKRLAATQFTEAEIEEILIGEVCPVCRINFTGIAGEWIGFDSEWLKRSITPRIGRTARLKWLFKLRHGWMYGRHWNKVRKLIVETRAT